jgi:hypothetical protein
MNKSLVRKTRILSLATLAALVSGQEGIEVSALLSGSRKRPVAKARGIFCQIAVKKLRYTRGIGGPLPGGNNLFSEPHGR